MSAIKLLMSQKNAVFRVIEKAGFVTDDFEWSGAGTKTHTYTNVPELTHKPTGYSFQFDYHDGDFNAPAGRVARFSPGRESESSAIRLDSWNDMLAMLDVWLKYITRETEEPDLWSGSDYDDFRAWTAPNTKFTDEERGQIEAGLARVEALLIEHSDKTNSSLNAIREDIKYLKHSAKSSGRRDWLMMFIGTIVSKLSDWGIEQIDWKYVTKTLLEGIKTLVIGE